MFKCSESHLQTIANIMNCVIQLEGVQMIKCTQRTSRASTKLTAGVQIQLKGPGSPRVLDAC